MTNYGALLMNSLVYAYWEIKISNLKCAERMHQAILKKAFLDELTNPVERDLVGKNVEL